MTNEQWDTVVQLRNEGYVVIIWTPEELGNASYNLVENRIIELGGEVIKDLS